MKRTIHLATMAILFLGLFLSSCDKNEVSSPPTIKILVNGDDITATPNIVVSSGARVEYQFEVSGTTVIDNLKTVISDISTPDKKVSREVIVAGQPNSVGQTVKGVLFVTANTEIMLVVKDLDGNEVAKAFTVKIQ